MPDVSLLLDTAAAGDPNAAAALLPLVYDELRKVAAARLAQERPGQTLQATALVHEAYLRLAGSAPDPGWNGRGHFFAAAAEAMRRILVETARRKGRLKRGGERRRLDIGGNEPAAEAPAEDLLAVDEALTALAAVHPEAAALVKLRYFAGLTLAEAAAATGLSESTADRRWRYARAWLSRWLDADPGCADRPDRPSEEF